MYKVINGRRYDTEKAQELACWSNGQREYERLYIKKTGEYFLHGMGNLSRYAESAGQNTRRDREVIVPLSLAEAKKWAEEQLDGGEYDRIFGGSDDDEEDGAGKLRHISLLMPLPVLEALKKKKSETGLTVTALMVKALREAGYGN